MEFWQIFA